ncbi:MAG: cation-translocating P-type ATPase [Myxococcota bacterium]
MTPTPRDSEPRDESGPAAPEAPWACEADEVVTRLRVSPDRGLDGDEAARRLERFGPNRLREMERRSVWRILVAQFESLVVLLLVVAAAISWGFGQTLEAIAIAAVLGINTGVGFFTELGAVRSMESLRKMGDIRTRVRRRGEVDTVSASGLVPGDVVLLERGDVVPADLRLVEASGLQADESTLTGESVPVHKQVDPVGRDAALADRTSMVFRGTAITHGSAEAVVVGTGTETELGGISELIAGASAGQTPLEERLDRLGRRLVWLTLLVAAMVSGAGLLAGRDVYLMVETGIALAVAAVPEGLPIVATVALSNGMWRMRRRHALIRRLSSVETLGAATLICTDKTGTLTENRMTAEELLCDAGRRLSVVRLDDGTARLEADGEPVDPADDPRTLRAIEVAVLANGAETDGGGESSEAADPMEVALIELGEELGRPRTDLLDSLPRVRVEPFHSDTKMMATLHRIDGGCLVAVKGAPEAVIESCARLFGSDEAFGEEQRAAWRQRNQEMAEEGLRVLGLATKEAADCDVAPYESLELLGLVGLLDPPRADVRDAIRRCQDAGIRVVMVTGDHPATARKIASDVGLIHGDDVDVVSGSEFDVLERDGDDVRRRFLEADVFARVSPKQKLDLVDLHQEHGGVVAMTGDGVNDAPALQSADIGIAMGRRGTEVAREAADMVLLDDAFTSIVSAVEQGRVIFANIRKFVIYLLSGNVGEILAVGAAAVVGAPLPLLPLQILYLNVLNDVFPALALGIGPGSGSEMQRPPRSSKVSVLEREHWWAIGLYGAIIAVAIGGVFWVSLGVFGFPVERAVTVAFLTLSISRLLHVFNMRWADSGLVVNEISRNPFVWAALALDVGLLLLAVYFVPLAGVLSLVHPGTTGWLLVAAASAVPLVAGQAWLVLRARRGATESSRP